MKVRSAGSFHTLDESMETMREIHSRAELTDLLRLRFDFWQPTDENVTIKPYGFDDRIQWDTHLICIDGKAALFSDGPLPPEPQN